MGIEIEKKFLVDHERWKAVNKPQATFYRQGYIVADQDRTVRIRIASDKAWLNIKSSASGITRKEFEYEIPQNDALVLYNDLTKAGIEKKRYKIQFKNKLWEIDEFLGDNEGLIIAEIELDTEGEEFEKPDWVTSEVTDDSRYLNSNLATCPYKSWYSDE